MLAEELLVQDKKAGYLLTDLGLRLVSDLYRKHRLIEVFLVNHSATRLMKSMRKPKS